MWCIPPQEDARFVAALEDVLEVYERPYDEQRPVVCLDEAAKQILGEVREPLAMQPGQEERFDNEYERRGTCALFLLFEPLVSWREVLVKAQRTGLDYADVVRYLCDEKYPTVEKIVLVQDNLNTHGVWSLYQAFEPHEAQRLAQRIEWHYTPKHGSWLNMAEIELSVLARQCLKERMETQQNIEDQVRAWQQRRNDAKMRVEWRFGVQDARCKLKRLYPKLLPS
jgi:DDE superfamily endonuclease